MYLKQCRIKRGTPFGKKISTVLWALFKLTKYAIFGRFQQLISYMKFSSYCVYCYWDCSTSDKLSGLCCFSTGQTEMTITVSCNSTCVIVILKEITFFQTSNTLFELGCNFCATHTYSSFLFPMANPIANPWVLRAG